ncbi:MAG: HAD family hydrolase [bacterium]
MSLRKYKHIIWDWNGTILDDVFLCVDIMNGILRRNNLPPITIEKYKEVFTFPVRDYYEKVGLNMQNDNFIILGKEFMDEYELRRNTCSLHDGAVESLEYFKSLSQSQSVLSAYSHDTLVEALNHYGILKYFDKVAGLDNIYAGSKLNNGKLLVGQIGIPSKEILLIGDTIHDFEVATELGIDCVLISFGHQSKEKIMKCGVPVIDSLNKLVNGKLTIPTK